MSDTPMENKPKIAAMGPPPEQTSNEPPPFDPNSEEPPPINRPIVAAPSEADLSEEPPPLPPELLYETSLFEHLRAYWNRPRRYPFWWHLTTRAVEVAHWSHPMDHFQTSSKDFYDKVQKTLEDQRIPRVFFSKALWKEAGLLSPERLYLRVSWNRYVGDICAAPFGRAFFFSFWVFVLPPVLSLFHIAGMISLFAGIEFGMRYLSPVPIEGFPVVYAFAPLLPLLVLWVRFSRQAINADPLTDFILGLTIIGPLIEILFRRLTYFERDTAAMFLGMIEHGFFQVADEVTKAKGRRGLSELDKKPELAAFMQVKKMGGAAK